MGTNRLVYVLAGLFLLSAGASASAKVKLTLATWYSIPETKAAVDAFVRRNPDIDVSILAGTGGTYDQ